MFMRVRKLAAVLLLLVLPWQALAAVAVPGAAHHHDATALDAGAASLHRTHAHDAGHPHHQHAASNSAQRQGSGSTDTSHAACTDVCCSPALAATCDLPLAATDQHGLMIPVAAHRLPWRAPDSLERPPRNSLV